MIVIVSRSFCYDGLKDWTCYWCVNENVTGKYPAEKVQLKPATVLAVVQSDGLLGTYGYIGYTEDYILVAFRGTSSVENWIKNLEFWHTPYPGALLFPLIFIIQIMK